MKRVFAFLLATMMIFSIVPVSPAIALETPTFSVSDAEGSVGEQITLSIDIASNPGVIAVGLQIGYDSSILELKSAVIKDFADTSFGPTTGNPFNISWEDVLNPNNTQNGTIAELTFLIKQGVALGDYAVTVSYVEDNVFNADFDNVYFATKNGKVTVAEQSVAVTGVTLDETISVNIGEKKIPAYTVNPDNATDKTVSFITSDPSVASVNETTGEITGVKKGLATITIITTDGGFTDTCVVTVSCAHTSKTQITEKASTCTKKGWDTYSQCDICGQQFDETDNEIDEIPYRALIAHTQSEPVRENEIAATCETAGNYDEVVYCTVCHTEISREMKTILPLEHDWNEGTVTTPATCTTDGVKTFTCKHDASHTYTKVIPAAGHSPAEAVKENEVAATCETAGSYEEVVYCSVCHAELSRETINILAAGHDWDKGKVTMAATCTTDGVRTYTCKHDASHTYTEAISAIGHTPTEAAIENEISATCSFTGSYDEVVYCSVCHEEVSRVTTTIPIDEDAHDWGEWVQTKAPTATESGEEIRICEHNPSHYETRKIPPVGSNETEYSFLDDEVIIVAPSGAIPEESTFDVQKIVPPPQEIVEKVKNQFGNSSSVLAYYEVRLTTGDGTPIIKLNGEITIKVKIPQEYLGSKSVQLLQEDENGKLVVMTSWWENDYLCYKTDWLEIY